ncbi:hypothetical protein EHS25_003945 [Saitozyma podzolica]|uniref:YTH domain-containing protein n=1 Tax=Saitozyma podzolica TaxID=1890683 RepID=A0A427YST3_9TREE|nr:hypothetical protein EHS25_003945 [Saitozyma podzolica]
MVDGPLDTLSGGSSPELSQQCFVHRGSRNGPPRQPHTNRVSSGVPSGGQSDVPKNERERKAYHPRLSSTRSDWVMWVGNVPPTTSHEELWKYLSTAISTGDTAWRGPSSIFLIARSSCAFVDFWSKEDLDRAVSFFNGRSLRPWDPRCPRMVCRVRRKDDELRAGVGAQRGTGMHRDWVKQQHSRLAPPFQVVEPPTITPRSVSPSPAVLEYSTDVDGRRRESSVDPQDGPDTDGKSMDSYASTNSSFLARYFPKRVFILKSMTTAELEKSVNTGLWRTQKHNEPILDQAFRTSPEVYLIFGANRSGDFFGYAKMIEAIDQGRAARLPQSSELRPQLERITVKDRTWSGSEPTSPRLSLSPSQPRMAMSSPEKITPAIETQEQTPHAEPSPPGLLPDSSSPPAHAQPLDPKVLPNPYFPSTGYLGSDCLGAPFKIQWMRVGSLPFTRTRHLRNSWNADRAVKVSRDGTEVEPTVGSMLMAEWDRLERPNCVGIRWCNQ